MSGRVAFAQVWKKFRYGEVHNRLRDFIPALLRRAVRGRPAASELWEGEFWALRDVTFELGPGDALGIIGPNGAGKSTILRLLTRILRPTHGYCSATGRIGALIDVSGGFHPDLTGRENVYLQGSIMGMQRGEVARKFDEIVAFSGIEWFLDTPVKRYSSGMHTRLGFSIAAHFDPDILIVDEVLAVGDAAFQRKAFARVTELVQRDIPVIVVSHQLDAITTFCNQALLLEAGTITHRGAPNECIAAYLQRVQSEPAHGAASAVALRQMRLQPGDRVLSGAEVSVILDCSIRSNLSVASEGVGVRVRSVESGELMFETTTLALHEGLPSSGTFAVEFELRMNVHPGVYVIEGFVWNKMAAREVASSLTTYLQVTGGDESTGPVQMSPRLRVVPSLAAG